WPWAASCSCQVLPEEGDGALPRQLRRRLVVARRGVVVEAVLRAAILVDLVAHARFLQLLLVRRIGVVDARVALSQMREDRRLDLRRLARGRCDAVVRRRRLQVRAHRRGEPVGRAATPAETGGPELPGT